MVHLYWFRFPWYIFKLCLCVYSGMSTGHNLTLYIDCFKFNRFIYPCCYQIEYHMFFLLDPIRLSGNGADMKFASTFQIFDRIVRSVPKSNCKCELIFKLHKTMRCLSSDIPVIIIWHISRGHCPPVHDLRINNIKGNDLRYHVRYGSSDISLFFVLDPARYLL